MLQSQQQQFENELRAVTELARHTGAASDPILRQRLAGAWMGLKLLRLSALRTLGTDDPAAAREAMTGKLAWSTWHRDLGELAMDVGAAESEIASEAGLTPLQRLFLFSRADTIYAGTSEIQRNLIGERALGLPPEPRLPLPATPGSRR